MIDRVYRLSENNSIIFIGLSGMLLPLCSMKMSFFFFPSICHNKSITTHAHYECTVSKHHIGRQLLSNNHRSSANRLNTPMSDSAF